MKLLQKMEKIYNVLKKDEMYLTLYVLNKVHKIINHNLNTPFVPKHQSVLGMIPMFLLCVPFIPFVAIIVLCVDLINKEKGE